MPNSVAVASQPEEQTPKPVVAAAVNKVPRTADALSRAAVQEPVKEEAAPASKQRKEASQDPNRMFGRVCSPDVGTGQNSAEP